MQTGVQQVEVNETTPLGVLFITRPPDLRDEPPREEHDQSKDDTKMEHICDAIRRVRVEDLSKEGLAFWEALGQLHREGRRAAAVPNLPHTKQVDGHSFTFEGCPQPLKPLLRELVRFPRPLITWDLFNDAPPPEFCAPQALQLEAPVLRGASGADAHPLRDPRRANTVGHLGYNAAAQSKDKADLTLEDWLEDFPGRVEKVDENKLYVVRLDEADGEFKLGLVATEGKQFEMEVESTDGSLEMAWHTKARWFKRRNDGTDVWGKNTAFEPHGSTDDLPVDSFIVEVEDGDMTEAGLADKWNHPKFKESFLGKLRAIADKYQDLRGASMPPARPKREAPLGRKAPAIMRAEDLPKSVQAPPAKSQDGAAVKRARTRL